MTKAVKLLGLLLFTLLLFVLAGSLAFYRLISSGEFRRFLVSEIEAKTDLKVQLGEADLEIGRILGIAFLDVALSEPDAARPAITAQRISARIALLPLFERKVVLYGLRLQRPTAHLVRDNEGRIPLLDKLLNLPFLKEKATPFDVDFHAIRIQGGEIDFDNRQAEQSPKITHFRDLDLYLERIRGQELRDFIKQLASLKQPEPQGAALDFDLKSAVETEGRKTTLRAKGKMIFSEQALEFRKALWNVQVQLSDLPAELVQQYAGSGWPVKSMSGVLMPRFHIEGNLATQFRVKGDLSFSQLAIDAPEIFDAPWPPGNGRAEFNLDWKQQRLGIPVFEFHSKELKLAMHGEMREIASDAPHLQLNLAAPSLPLPVLRKYLPLKKIGSPQLEGLLARLQGGELQVRSAGIQGTLGEVQNLAQSAAKGLAWFDGEFREVAIKLDGDDYLPLRGVQGRVRLDKGVLTFQNLQATYGQSRFTNVGGHYHWAPEGQASLDLNAIGELELAEVREQIRLGIFPPATKLFSFIGELEGKGQVNFSLQQRGESKPQFDGKLTLDNARLRFDDIPLTEVKGEIAISPSEIRGERLRALVANSPIQIQLLLANYASDGAIFDLGIESPGVKAGTVTRLLLSSGSPEDPGIVRGSVRYYGPLAKKGERKFTGTLDLSGVQLFHKPLLQPLRDLAGRVKIDDTGIDLQGLKGQVVGSPFEFSGRWRYRGKPQLLFELTAPTLDLPHLISQIDTESSDWYASLTAQGKVSLAKGRIESFEFNELKTDLSLDRRVWQLGNVAMRSAGGTVQGVATVADRPDTLAFSVKPVIQNVPLQGVLNWFEAGEAEMTGKVNITGSLESFGKNGAERKRNLNGAFNLRIQDGTIHRLRVLVQILNLLDLSRWFSLQMPDLGKAGIRFRSINADFKVARGVLSTQNLIVDSDDLRMTGGGKIDVANEEIDFVLAVRPFAGIDTAIRYIPLIGRGIAAIKNSFLVASFNVRGPLDDPTITPAPLSTLSEVFLGVLGIPKNMIGLGDEEIKSELEKVGKPQIATDKPLAPYDE